MPKESNGEGVAGVLNGPDVVATIQTLGDVLVEKRWEARV
jgi:hypothetical protein